MYNVLAMYICASDTMCVSTAMTTVCISLHSADRSILTLFCRFVALTVLPLSLSSTTAQTPLVFVRVCDYSMVKVYTVTTHHLFRKLMVRALELGRSNQSAQLGAVKEFDKVADIKLVARGIDVDRSTSEMHFMVAT
jgi:hypothetical protein